MSEARTYGVSYGNGNDGVSQLYPDFYVTTDKPYKLALGAMIDQFKPDWMARAKEACTVDGEAEFTIYATISDPLEDEPEPVAADAESDDDSETVTDDDAGSWSDANGAWKIAEVFPVAADDVRDSAPSFDSIEDALSPEALALIADESE